MRVASTPTHTHLYMGLYILHTDVYPDTGLRIYQLICRHVYIHKDLPALRASLLKADFQTLLTIHKAFPLCFHKQAGQVSLKGSLDTFIIFTWLGFRVLKGLLAFRV